MFASRTLSVDFCPSFFRSVVSLLPSRKESYYEKSVCRTSPCEISHEAVLSYVYETLCAEPDINRMRDNAYWANMSPRDFELAVGSLYQDQGYDVMVTPYCGDGGKDLILEKDGEVTYLQCKHYSTGHDVPVKDVREFYGVCQGDKVKHGVIACTAGITHEASDFIQKVAPAIEVVYTKDLIGMDYPSKRHVKPINERQTPEIFGRFLQSHNFIPCMYAWMRQTLYLSKDEAMAWVEDQINWPNVSFMVKQVNARHNGRWHKYFVVLAVPNEVWHEMNGLPLCKRF